MREPGNKYVLPPRGAECHQNLPSVCSPSLLQVLDGQVRRACLWHTSIPRLQQSAKGGAKRWPRNSRDEREGDRKRFRRSPQRNACSAAGLLRLLFWWSSLFPRRPLGLGRCTIDEPQEYGLFQQHITTAQPQGCVHRTRSFRVHEEAAELHGLYGSFARSIRSFNGRRSLLLSTLTRRQQ